MVYRAGLVIALLFSHYAGPPHQYRRGGSYHLCSAEILCRNLETKQSFVRMGNGEHEVLATAKNLAIIDGARQCYAENGYSAGLHELRCTTVPQDGH